MSKRFGGIAKYIGPPTKYGRLGKTKKSKRKPLYPPNVMRAIARMNVRSLGELDKSYSPDAPIVTPVKSGGGAYYGHIADPPLGNVFADAMDVPRSRAGSVVSEMDYHPIGRAYDDWEYVPPIKYRFRRFGSNVLRRMRMKRSLPRVYKSRRTFPSKKYLPGWMSRIHSHM